MNELKEKIKAFFVDSFGVTLNDTLLDLLIDQAEALFVSYALTDEQKKICYLLYVGCQISNPPYYLIPVNQMITSLSVRDFSASFAPIVEPLIGTGFCGTLQALLKQFGMQNKKIHGIIIR